MREKRQERIKKRYFQLRRQASLNRMINGEFAFKINEALYETIKKLEIRFPSFIEAYN